MAEKILNTRIALKIDTLENWKSSTLPLKKGEIAFATVAANEGIGLSEPVVMVKVCGEEGKTFNELPWSFHAKSSDVLSACKDEQSLKTFIANEISNAGIATDEAMKALAARVETLEKAGYQDADQVTASINSAITDLDLGNTYEAKGEAAKVQTALNTYKETNDIELGNVKAIAENAYVKPVTGIAKTDLAADVQASLGKADTALQTHQDISHLATKTEVATVDGKFANYKTAADQKVIDDAQDAEIAKKVDKVEGKDLIATSEITRLASVTNYDDTQVKADIAKKADAATMTTELGKKVDKAEGYSLISDDEIARLADVDNYDDTEVRGLIGGNTDAIDALEEYVGTIPEGATATDIVGYIQEKTAGIATEGAMTELSNRVKAIEDDYLVEADIANFETKDNVKKIADDLAAYVESNDEALAGVKATAEDARTEDEVNSQIDAKITALDLGNTYEPKGAEDRVKGYVDQKFTDANLGQYTTEQEVKDIVDGVIAGAADSETYNSLTKLVDYIDAHGGEATEMAQAIETLEGKVETIEGKPAYGITETQVTNWDGEVGAKALAETKTTAAEVKAQIEAYGYATEADLTLAENRIGVLEGKPAAGITTDDISAWNAEKGANAAAAAAQKTADDYIEAHENDYTNEQIDAAIDADVKALADGAVATNAAGIKTINDTIATYGDIVTHDVDEFATSAQGTKADSALQEIEVGTGLKISEKADNKQTIDIDEAVTFIFNCGDSNV